MNGIVIVPTSPGGSQVVSKPSDLTIVAQPQPFGVAVAAGAQGPAGTPGATGPIGPAGGTAISAVAGEAVGGQRIVFIAADELVYYASNQTVAHGLVALGMTTGAASLGASVDILRRGEMTEVSWSWTLEQPIYLGDNGLLTQTLPESPAVFQRIVGFPITATRIIVDFREPIYLV